jgi:copper transport protein
MSWLAAAPVGDLVISARNPVAKTTASLCVVMVILVASANPAWAHATLVSSSPSDGTVLRALPPTVTLTFDEPVRPVPADLKVLDPDGKSVGGAVAANGPRVTMTLPRTGGPGTYTLTWRVISVDSHPVSGVISFSLGHPSRAAAPPVARTSTAVSALFTVVRFAGFAGFALLAGAIAFCSYGVPRAVGLPGVRSLITTGWAALVAATFGSLLLEGPYGAGAGLGALVRPELLSQTLSGTYGKALTVRVLLLALLPFLFAYGVPRLKTGSGRFVFGGIAAALMVAIAATWSLGGHAATGNQPIGAVPADVAHLCAMALWLGGLAALMITLRTSRATPDVAAGADRFSAMAATAVALLAGTGLYQAWLRVRTPAAVVSTRYGFTLTVKVALVCLVLSVGFFSRRTLRRRATELVPGLLARLVAVEAAGAVTVVAVTAVLVGTEPAAKALAAEPVTLTGRYDSGGERGSLRLRLPSQARGLSSASLTIRDSTGHLGDVPGLDVRWSLPQRRIGPIDARVGHDGPGRYTAVTAPITATGRWRIAITIRTSEINETTVLLSQTIR